MSNLQTALDHARKGYYVHPLAPKGKTPIAEHGSNDATRDEDVIRDWWDATPHANVGISLDKTGLVDIAPDCPEWADRFKANGMPRTVLYTSGGGAGHWHTLYRLPQGGPVARINVSKQYDIMSQGNAVAPGSIHPSGKAYVLHTPLMPVEDLPLAPAWAVDMLQAHVSVDRKAHTPADWLGLPSGAVLAHSRRFQALGKANDQLRAVCAGEAVTLMVGTGKDKAPDGSTSIQRSVFVNQLLRAHYPPSEIRALALHFQGVLESDPDAFENDVDRLLFKYTPKDYKPESTGVVVEALRGGRPYEITTGELLDAYHLHADSGVNGIVLEWSVSEAAERLGLSTGTIKRREAELIADGQIKREYGRVILSPATWEIRSQPIAMTQMVDEPVVTICDNPAPEAESVYETTIGSQPHTPHQDAPNTHERAVCKEQAHVEITHSPGLDPPAPNRDLLAFVRALAKAAAEPGWFLRDYVDWPDRALHTEAARLGAVLDATDDGEAMHADIAAEYWKRTTRDGRHFAKLEARQARDMAGVERLRSVLRGPPSRAEECVLSIGAGAQQARI